MLELLCQVLLQGLLVAHQPAAALEDCCPVKEVQGFSQDVCFIFSIENPVLDINHILSKRG